MIRLFSVLKKCNTIGLALPWAGTDSGDMNYFLTYITLQFSVKESVLIYSTSCSGSQGAHDIGTLSSAMKSSGNCTDYWCSETEFISD